MSGRSRHRQHFDYFFELPEIKGIDEESGANFLAFYWGGAMIGRFLGAISLSKTGSLGQKLMYMVPTSFAVFLLIYGLAYSNGGMSFAEVSPYIAFLALNVAAFVLGKSLAGRTLSVFALIAAALLVVTVMTTGEVAFWSVIAIGLFNSVMWSNIFTLAIDGLGKYTSQGSSLLVMAVLGGALIPPVQGFVADMLASEAEPTAGIQISFIVPVVCYAYITWYGLKGCRAGRN